MYAGPHCIPARPGLGSCAPRRNPSCKDKRVKFMEIKSEACASVSPRRPLLAPGRTFPGGSHTGSRTRGTEGQKVGKNILVVAPNPGRAHTILARRLEVGFGSPADRGTQAGTVREGAGRPPPGPRGGRAAGCRCAPGARVWSREAFISTEDFFC